MYDSGTQNQIDPTVATNIRIVYPMGRWETHTLFNLEHSVQARVFFAAKSSSELCVYEPRYMKLSIFFNVWLLDAFTSTESL